MKLKAGFQLLAVALSSLFAVACQSLPQSSSSRYNNLAFMELWDTYTHCLATDQLQPASWDSRKLHDVSETSLGQTTFQDLLPNQLRKNIVQPSPRLAVDLQAMASACSLHTGNLAASAGELDAARAMFRQVLNIQGRMENTYYASQARAKLAELELALQASIR